ncbi:MAG TPA: Ig-like domain-containing protein [Chloroflexota bacterium]|nr:Ig-like domain-containing protein [Chloroflexota bacterium]
MFGGARVALGLSLLATLAAGMLAAPASAQPGPSSSGWQAGPGAAGDPVYQGYIDIPANGSTVASGTILVGGWFVDTTAVGWAGADDIQVFSGAMGAGGTMLAKGIVAQNRPDVGAAFNYPFWSAAGYSASVPIGSLGTGSKTLNVYVHTAGKGWWFKQVAVNVGGAAAPAAAPAPGVTNPTASGPVVTISDPRPGQNVPTTADFTLRGAATDPTAGAKAIDKVEIWIDGRRGDPGARFVGNANLDGGGGWSLSFSPTKFPSVNSNLYVYAHSTFSGKETVATVNFNIQDRT